MEDKQKILDLLLQTLQATRENADLKGLTYKTQRHKIIMKLLSANSNPGLSYLSMSRWIVEWQ